MVWPAAEFPLSALQWWVVTWNCKADTHFPPMGPFLGSSVTAPQVKLEPQWVPKTEVVAVINLARFLGGEIWQTLELGYISH